MKNRKTGAVLSFLIKARSEEQGFASMQIAQ
jgi:hypothetical protein